MCKLQQREKKRLPSITGGFISQNDGVIITRSASCLCTIEWITGFNDSFSHLLSPRYEGVSQIKSNCSIWSDSPANNSPWRRLRLLSCRSFLVIRRLRRASLQPAALTKSSVLFTFCFLHSILPTHHPRFHHPPHFILLFFCGWWKDSRRERKSTWRSKRATHATYLRASTRRQLSQINERCLAFLISLTSFCLSTFLFPRRSRQILSLVLLSFCSVIMADAVLPSIILEWPHCEGPPPHSMGLVLAADANER